MNWLWIVWTREICEDDLAIKISGMLPPADVGILFVGTYSTLITKVWILFTVTHSTLIINLFITYSILIANFFRFDTMMHLVVVFSTRLPTLYLMPKQIVLEQLSMEYFNTGKTYIYYTTLGLHENLLRIGSE